MTMQPHELSNLYLAQKYFEKLPADDVSRRYAAGEVYISNWLNRLKIFFSPGSTLNELNKFYPYQPVVKSTNEMYQQKKEQCYEYALATSTIGIFGLYYSAKQGSVMPILNKFGRFFKTHRLFRHYVWAAVLPYLVAETYVNYFFLNQTDYLWQVHATRLNLGAMEDPTDSQYPTELLPLTMEYRWNQSRTHPYDLPKKNANEVEIFLAPDYANVEEWQKQEFGQINIQEKADDDDDEDEE